MANQRKQGVRNAELEILDDLHVVRRDDDAEVAEPGHLAPNFEPSQTPMLKALDSRAT